MFLSFSLFGLLLSKEMQKASLIFERTFAMTIYQLALAAVESIFNAIVWDVIPRLVVIMYPNFRILKFQYTFY